MDIQFIYFDLDDTLLDHRHAERHALADVQARHPGVFGHLSLDTLQDTYHTINAPLWRQYASGDIDKATVKNQRFVRLLEALEASDADADAINRFYLDRYAEHWRFTPGAREAFQALAARYPVGVLTNGFAEVQHRKLDQFPVLRDASKAVVISEEVGQLKPHPAVFEHATDVAQVPGAHILYVGDSHHSDVQGGHAAGWHVAWYQRDGDEHSSTDVDCFVTFSTWDTLTQRLL